MTFIDVEFDLLLYHLRLPARLRQSEYESLQKSLAVRRHRLSRLSWKKLNGDRD